MLVLVSIDDAVSRKACSTAIRVMHDNDILDAEKMLRHRDRAERIDGSATGDDDLEKSCRRCDLFTLGIRDNFPGIRLAELPSDGSRDAHGAWVIAVNDDRSQGNRFGELLAHRRFVEAWLFRKHVRFKIFHSLLRKSATLFRVLAMQQQLAGSLLRELCQIHSMAVHIKKSPLTEI
jgi:hypothetical protein